MIGKFLALTMVHLVTAQLGQKCTESNDITRPNFIPHPTNCSKFFSCGSGIYGEMECPARLHFNDQLKTCDWPSQAGCSFRNSHQPIPVKDDSLIFHPVNVPGQACLPSPDRNRPRLSPHTTNCEQFLICTGTWTLMHCPRGLLFSVETDNCEFPKHAKCCPTCTNTTRRCSAEGERMSNPINCRNYFLCHNQTFIEIECQEGHIFSSVKGECTAGTSCFTFPENPVNHPSCPVDNLLYPHYEDCSRFFICNGGELVEQLCPPHKLFSVTHMNCQFKFFAVCAGNDTKRADTTELGEALGEAIAVNDLD